MGVTSPARIGVVGAGWWSWTAHLPSLARNPDAELVAICDPDPSRVAAAVRTFGAAAGYPSLDRMLAEARLDGVVVATPHSTHAPLVRTALEADVHVLVEKPLTVRADDAAALVRLAEERGLHLTVGLTYQYAPAALDVARAVRGEIGELVAINAEFSSGTLALFQTRDPADASLGDPAVPHGITYSDPATGGGQAHTQLTHLLGAALWAAERHATDVAALMDDRGLDVDVVDALAFRLEGGALGVASSTGTTPGGVPVRHRLRFHGTGGMVEWDLLAADASIHLPDGRMRYARNPESRPAYDREGVSASFVETVLTGAPTPAPGRWAAACVALLEAAHAAARSGRTLPVAATPCARLWARSPAR
jgi:predicted dehydrogenase